MDRDALIRQARTPWDWWREGIVYVLPPWLRARWFPRPEILEVRQEGERLLLTHRSAADEIVASQRVPLTTDPIPPEISGWLSSQVSATAKVIVYVPEARALSRTLRLPLAVEPDLHGMLEIELDRLSPFTPEAVYSDAAVCARDAASQSLTCRFALVKRQEVDPILHQLQLLGRPAQAIHIDPPFEIALDLLPPGLRPRGDQRARQRTVIAQGLALALFLTALYAPLSHQEALLAEWQQRVAEQRESAGMAQNLSAQRTLLEQRAQFAVDRRNQTRPAIETLTELTGRLPDSAWVNRLMMQAGDVQLFGEAESATALVPLLESSDLFQQVDFRSPTTRNEATGKDRFHIGFHLTTQAANK